MGFPHGTKSKQRTHGSDNGDQKVLSVLESLLNLLTEVRVRDLDVVLGVGVAVDQVEETLNISAALTFTHPSQKNTSTYVGNIEELVLSSGDVGDIHVVGLANQHTSMT